MAKKSALDCIWDDLTPKKSTTFTKKDAVVMAASAAYIAGYVASAKKAPVTVTSYRTPFVLPDPMNCSKYKGTVVLCHDGDDHKENPTLQSSVEKAVTDAFKLASLRPGEITVTLAPKVVRIKVKMTALEAGANIVKKLTPYLQFKFDCENLVVTKEGAYILIDWPHNNYTAFLGDFFLDPEFKQSPLTSVAIGSGADGNVFYDIAKMPHMLVAGTTGSGKSVFLHSLILSLLMKNTPDDIELYMVDPKMTEYEWYTALPYCHVVQSAQDAVGLLSTLVSEMKSRYATMQNAGARDIIEYNAKATKKMPRKVLFIDELSQLMSDKQYRKQAEGLIVQIAQLARAAGIHLVLATQRPTVNVVTGLIKANIECRVALKVNSRTDSMVILDQIGAEKLVGQGDLLFINGKNTTPQRLQGAFVSTDEICNVVGELHQNVVKTKVVKRRPRMRKLVAALAAITIFALFALPSLAYEGHSYWAKDNKSYYQKRYTGKAYEQYLNNLNKAEKETETTVESWSYTPKWTISAEPTAGSIDEYTISDAYVKPRIRTRDRYFVSHIDELHFTDD